MAIIFIRTLIIFLSLMVLMRLLGKRQMRELELSELVVSVLVADLAATPLQDIGIPLLNGLVPIVTLFACELFISGLTLSSIRVRDILYGKPEFLIVDGELREKAMRRARVSLDELMEELRGKEILDICSVKYAVLETDGSLSTILMPAERPLNARQYNCELSDIPCPTVLIEDGRTISSSLPKIGRDEKWLEKLIKKQGAQTASDVFILLYYDDEKIYCTLKEKKNA